MQTFIAFAIVAVAFALVGRRVFWDSIAAPLSRYLLKRGKVGWAMRLHARRKK